MTGRVYVRKFDWDEANALREQGCSIREIAERFGVSQTAVQLATNPNYLASRRDYHSRWQRSGTCPDCGAPATRRCRGRQARCVACAAKAATTTVRQADLKCCTCQEWKPDKDYPRGGSASRRGRARQCRDCQTKQKRAYRARHQVPCSAGCGDTVYEKERRDPSKPLLCHSCATRRIAA